MVAKEKIEEVHKVFQDFLVRHDHKYTSQRETIVDVLFSVGEHIEADDFIDLLRQKGKRISRGTIYSTLKLLVEAKLVRKLKIPDNRVHYEFTYGEEHHDHLICVDCGKIFEFHNEAIERIQEEISLKYGLKIVNHSHVIHGSCQRKNCPHRKVSIGE